MMHKKNYVDFARMIRTQKYKIEQERIPAQKQGSIELFFDGAEKELSIIIDELVTIFQNDNPAFDADKFLSACEIKEENK
jgi:hypothetical protein